MSEADLWMMAIETTHALQTEETTFLTVLFGYLIAAYGLGAKVTRRQVMVFNAIYLVIICGLLYNMFDFWTQVDRWVARAMEADFGMTGERLVLRGRLTILACASMVLGSLYFMWSIRHPNTD